MTTAITHINRAMYLIGASSPINPAKAETIAEAFLSLQDLIGWLQEEGFTVLNSIIPYESGDEVNFEFWSNPVIQNMLAVNIAPLFQLPVPTDVFDDAGKYFKALEEKQALVSVLPKEVTYPPTLPVGSANMKGRFPRAYYGRNSTS